MTDHGTREDTSGDIELRADVCLHRDAVAAELTREDPPALQRAPYVLQDKYLRVQAERQALLGRLKSADGAPPNEGRPIEVMEVVQESVTRRVHAVSRQVLMARIRALQQAEARIWVPYAEEAETRRHAFFPTVPR